MVSLFSFLYYTGRIAVIAEDSVRFAHSGPSQRILRGLTTTCLRWAPLLDLHRDSNMELWCSFIVPLT